MNKVALVVGVSGVTGTPLAEQLLHTRGWKVYGASRRAPELDASALQGAFTHISGSISQTRAATRNALGKCADVTHVFIAPTRARGTAAWL
jgi:NAD(P)-dependent dehydrogenase (short-subunit alcohol dehydrogenase family)